MRLEERTMSVTRLLETARTAKLDLLGTSAWTVIQILLQILEMKNAHSALKATMANPVIKVIEAKIIHRLKIILPCLHL